MEYTYRYESPLGPITLASDGTALTGLWFDGQKYFGETLEAERREESLPIFEEAGRWLDLYFHGTAPEFTPPLRPHGTPFRTAVWEVLRSVPYGNTVSYGELAERVGETLGRKVSPRSIGGAVGHNPISLLIPCHRVVGADGSLTGYAGGIEKKLWLLRREGVDMSRLCPG